MTPPRPSVTCDHERLLAYLRRSPYRSERVWTPLARLATRFAHRRGVCEKGSS